MENVEIARILNEYGDLLEIHEENPFRVRSYRKAAQTVAGLSRPVAQLIAAGEDVTELPGIGSSMATHLKVESLTGTRKRSMIAVSESNPNMPPLRREEERCP